MERKRLPVTRMGLTHKGVIWAKQERCPKCGEKLGKARIKFWVTLNFFEDGGPGELFITLDEAGGTLDGLCDAWATAMSVLLQLGWTWDEACRKFEGMMFEPRGKCEDPGVRFCGSIVDYVMKWGRIGTQAVGVQAVGREG